MHTLVSSTASAVRAELSARGLRQVDVADALGLSQSSVSERLAGRVQFTLDELGRLAAFLRVDVHDLIGGDL